MAFSSAPSFGGHYLEKHRYPAPSHAIQLAEKIRLWLGFGIYSPIHRYRVEVWAFVVWVHVPGYRPRFVPLSALA